ncbi:MAG: SDR family oxidoreductase [Anaerolineae bacterium]|nr:SDR family oxidoreductase [Anaerolineae bacterium]
MELQEQIVVITGAGQGIGRSIAEAFAREGSAVVVNDLHAESAQASTELIRAAGGRAVAAPADVGDRAQVEAMFAAAKAEFGAVTTLVNNAGYVPYHPAADYPPDIWDRTLATNLTGVFHCSQVAIQHMTERGGGSIVTIASVHASATLPGTLAYAATKAGVVSMTRTMALELGERSIRVNCVSPGAIATDGLKAYFDSLPDDERAAAHTTLMSWHPLGRFGKPEDIADVVVYLCTERAAFINGANIVADGGMLARLF